MSMHDPTVPASAVADGSSPAPPHGGLSRTLKARHLTMISIGGIIGVGLFVGSSTAIIAAGPASFLSAPRRLVRLNQRRVPTGSVLELKISSLTVRKSTPGFR